MNEAEILASLKNKMLRERVILGGVFLFSTALLIYQSATVFSWDLSVYIEIAKYWAGFGGYYSPLRPPLVSFILIPLVYIGASFAKYSLILLSSVIFLYGAMVLARNLNINKIIFYVLLITPFTLIYGTVAGTELISTGLLMIGIAFSLERKWAAGIFLALAGLSRFNLLVFGILLVLLLPDMKKFIISAGAFCLLIGAFFLYNFLKFGNYFTSIADNYALNVLLRSYITSSSKWQEFLLLNISLLPFFILGVIFFVLLFYESSRRKKLYVWVKNNKGVIVLTAVAVVTIYQYVNIPLKQVRYLFVLVVFVAIFSALGAAAIRRVSKKIFAVVMVLFVMFSVIGFFTLTPFKFSSDEQYYSAKNKLIETGLLGCQVMSSDHPMLTAKGVLSEPLPRKESVKNRLNDGVAMILFFHANEPEWIRDKEFVDSLPHVYSEKDFVIIHSGSSCAPSVPIDHTYVSRLAEDISEIHGYEINTNPCFILFHKVSLAEKSCNFINFNGFVKDTNRAFG